ncbi:helix-turn-helix domain-containing protein [Mycobacterium sp. 23]|uniref:AraC family transcriptional regulator n=1 Tax=Mycobacterium sp. 23 TaxID=3400424 RepID=UPI003AABE2A3
MNSLDFDSCDLGETEEFLVRNYTAMRIEADGENRRARIHRRWAGPVTFDELSFSYDMSYDAEPLGKVLLCRVHSGRILENFIGEPQDVFAPGDVTLLSPPELPYSGQVCRAGYDLTGLHPALLDRVASSAPGVRSDPVRLTGHRPVTAAAGRRLSAVIDYLRDHVLSDPAACASPLVAGSFAAYLAAAVLDALPSNALLDATATDRRDAAKPVLVRRATAFIDENAHRDIMLSDIAEHVYVTPRTLQYMFRQHLDCTPMDYLRRIRLHRAHHELLSGTRASTTVTQIAHRWGFAHVGRFAAYYREIYGRSPHDTLRN